MPEKPRQQVIVTHDDVDISISGHSLESVVTLRENKGSDASLSAMDSKGETFISKVDTGDIITIYQKYEDISGDPWHQVFGGYVVELNPEMAKGGESVGIQAYGFDIALDRMRAAIEYGTQSVHPLLDRLQEIMLDSSYGLLPAFVEKILNTSLPSGYSFTPKIYNDASSLKYVYSPYAPVNDCVKNVLELLTAAKYPSAGYHWTCLPNGKTAMLCIDQIGNHHSPVSDVWPTFAPISELRVAKNMLTQLFKKTKPEGNYIVYFGKYEFPTSEYYTEGHASEWGSYYTMTLADETDAPYVKVGSYSLLASHNYPRDFFFPKTGSLGLDMTKIETRRNIPVIGCYVYKENADTVEIRMYKDESNYFKRSIFSLLTEADYVHVNVPIGNYYATASQKENKWDKIGSPLWSQINKIGFYASYGSATWLVFIDDLRINGIITRAAYNSLAIQRDHATIKLINDSLAKSCNLNEADDSDIISQLAKSELLRAQTNPITGTATIKLNPQILPGQLVPVKAARKTAGYHIDMNMRITEVKHVFDVRQCATQLTLTDDLLNSYPREPTTMYNAMLKATNPDFQNRDMGDLKAREIDVDQKILAYNYPS